MRMRGRSKALTVGWLLLLAALQCLAFVALWQFAVGTERGQLLDTVALTGNTIGQDRVDEPVGTVLNAVSAVSLLAATVFIGFIALIRGRILLAVVTTGLIAGANVTTQVLKYVIERPDFGADPERDGAGNSLPSGHTTVAAAVAVALVLALPRRLRAWGAMLAASYAAITGAATLSAGWHRPSDAMASMLVVGAWAAVAGIVLLLNHREDAEVNSEDAHQLATTLLLLTGVALLGVAALAVDWTGEVLSIPADELSRRRLFVAYAGGGAGIAGVAFLMVGLVLATVHRVVPRHVG
ncbi:phosphatase PAP2 family protein [Solwaraspora sp. WMMD1047]|uniref:phosphatase PAP2 family protein n=1 Tax=Solwaraspora sp. WMMD1047 TaxID=3016102 RepID=UPI0024171542|nr:phosphatase PAP2 family protein [Solwaraspora sp. WMMD1047]MDG4831759.1 phosphatase PAP2 family protein [Solwaraspora sp. WMMD1047]